MAGGIRSGARQSSRTRAASRNVLASATVGPEAMSVGSSLTTSESSKAQRPALRAAARASPPPFTREQCLRTVLSAAMSAPEASNPSVSARLSSSVSPGAGATRSAEPPPLSRTTIRTSSATAETMSRRRRVAASPAASGSGCPPVAISTLPADRPALPCGTMTSPPASPPRVASAAAPAIPALAFPAPTSNTGPSCRARIRPWRSRRTSPRPSRARHSATRRRGSTAASAAA